MKQNVIGRIPASAESHIAVQFVQACISECALLRVAARPCANLNGEVSLQAANISLTGYVQWTKGSGKKVKQAKLGEENNMYYHPEVRLTAWRSPRVSPRPLAFGC